MVLRRLGAPLAMLVIQYSVMLLELCLAEYGLDSTQGCWVGREVRWAQEHNPGKTHAKHMP